ncbi:MAG: class II aldolase/adducin family protein [Alphaproteobacteria bacterium]|nr:class II aldolase/adducin family protein [Alphaproteobacteria bacterium]MCB9930687.1 class II aldolase/adducin family protein [Alphaproteobacteria bacterium]
MPATAVATVPSLKGKVSPEEWETRVELAAFYRLVAQHGWDDLVGTHISARVPGTDGKHFLLNPYGLLFDEITASSLVKVDFDGQVLHESAYPVNAAGFTIHSAVLAGREDVVCAAHTHTVSGMALSAVQGTLRPVHQKALRFHNALSYHPYEGIADDPEECARLQRDLGENDAMVLENHGLLTCGRTIRGAWALLYNLEKCCQVQVALEAAGGAIVELSDDIKESTYRQFQRTLKHNKQGGSKLDGWESSLRLLKKADPSFLH